MPKGILCAILISTVGIGPALALDSKAYEGTWTGPHVKLIIPAGIDKGAASTYYYNGALQAPQMPTVQGNKVKLTNPSATYIVIGPAKGKSLPFFWTDGTHKFNTILAKQ